MLKRLPIAGVVLAALSSTTALAADLPIAPPPPPPMFTWTGFYLGVNVGLAGDRFVYPFTIVAPVIASAASGSASITSSGIIGGGQVGFNWQLANNIVLGLEADFDGAAIRGKVTANAAGILGGVVPIAANFQAGSRIDYIGTVRARVGYAWDRFLVYGTGGFAYGSVNSSLSASAAIGGAAAAFATSQNNGVTGWTAGGGFEYAITRNLTVKTEYLYVNLGTNTIVNTALFGGALGVNINQRTQANIVRAGLNYKFDWLLPPVIASY